MSRVAISAVLVGLAVAACTSPGAERTVDSSTAAPPLPRDTTARTQTDSLAYHLTFRNGQYEGSASATFRNAMPDTAYFVNCNGVTSFTLQRLQDTAWSNVWSPPMNACLSAPIIVAPGDSLHRTVPLLDGFQPDSAALQRSPADTGIYRIVWSGLVHHYHAPNRTASFGTTPPIELRISNRFLLIGAPW
jgi:hypothetical protein